MLDLNNMGNAFVPKNAIPTAQDRPFAPIGPIPPLTARPINMNKPALAPMDCVLKRVSPTALMLFESQPDKFVKSYVFRYPRTAQTPAMAIGSAFDARVKDKITTDLLGQPSVFESLFESSVDQQHRSWAKIESKAVLDEYVQQGALADMLLEMQMFQLEPRFEFSANTVLHTAQLHNAENAASIEVPIGGKPDCYFISSQGVRVVIDWKVTGYMSQASPAKGYLRIRPEYRSHRDAYVITDRGMSITVGCTLKEDWETQLMMYSWILDGRLSFSQNEWVLGIEQLVYRPNKQGVRELRSATFRVKRDVDRAMLLWDRLVRMWDAVLRQHYFLGVSKERSDEIVQSLWEGADYKELAKPEIRSR